MEYFTDPAPQPEEVLPLAADDAAEPMPEEDFPAEPDPSLPFGDVSDEDMVTRAQAGETEAMDVLIDRYKNFVRSRARNYFLVGADREDIIQEGMIGLYKAIRDYRPEKQCTFRAFAELCVTRQIITAIKTATRQKHQPLNSYVSLNRPVYEEESERTLMDIITPPTSQNPEDLMISEENRQQLERKIHELLSDLERAVLASYLDEKSYQQIAADLHRHVKSIDNALVRVKKKLEKNLYTEEEEETE